ncbi:tetratricopeptide repeat protein [Gloeocapsa sp. PCC 73106]|uniref:tetratricopeptide repeat protein n=1 Tax=Gloeocapsa sp. PCC 73106 TaxID=102232 RepID=UPI0002AC20D0|nr:tetratricopeptide repeat protein [Gloeocapsa sp. PCC 73106]ELR98062.1 tetratricopeptide repeat protein [Gloeocapsa sp. PCC 73106]
MGLLNTAVSYLDADIYCQVGCQKGAYLIAALLHHGNAYNNLGQLLEKQGKIAEAEAIYREAIALDPRCYGIYLNLVNILLKKRQFSEANRVIQDCLQLKLNITQLYLDLINNLR